MGEHAGDTPGKRTSLSPNDYPDYVALDQQRDILGELGFMVAEDEVERLRKAMEEDENSRIYTEGYPFYRLLTFIGMPKRDRETWKVVEYPEQAYWFDWEAMDVEGDYVDILRGVEKMSGGELSFGQIDVDSSRVDWEWGEGSIRLSFACCGKPFEIEVRVENDWLDPSVIEKLNQVIEQAGAVGGQVKRIYACDDGGQGTILFYRDADWARAFRQKTGITIE